MTQKTVPSAADIAKVGAKDIDDGEVEAAADSVWKLYSDLGADDQLAKGPDLRKAVSEALAQQIASPVSK